MILVNKPSEETSKTYEIKRSNINICVITIQCSHTNFLKEVSAILILVPFITDLVSYLTVCFFELPQ